MKFMNLLFKDRSLGYKFLALPGIPVIVAVMFISANILRSQNEVLMEKAKTRASFLTKLSILTVSNEFVVYNKNLLDSIVDNLSGDTSVDYAVIVDSSDNRILAHSDHDWDGKIIDNGPASSFKEPGTYEVSGDINISGNKYGALKIGFSLKDAYQEVAQMKQRLLFIAFTAVVLGAVFSIILARLISTPIKALVEQTRIIVAGNFENRIVYQSKDILGQLANEFNKMVSALKDKQQQIMDSEARLRRLVENMPVMMEALDENFNVVVWNRECERVTGYGATELEGNPDSVKMLYPDDDYREQMIAELVDLEFDFRDKEYTLTGKAGAEKTISWSNISGRFPIPGWHTWAIGVDVTERKRKEIVQAVQLRLVEHAADHSVMELLQKLLDEAEALTDSEIGFYHFVEDDQKTLSLQTWSTNTLEDICTAESEGRHYLISEAGVWVDCVRERRPVVHNDYASLTHKKGMPEGHAPVIRELVVPVIRGEKIVAILGVGNKRTDYEANDIEMVQQLADLAWEIVIRRRAEEGLRESEEKYRNLFENLYDVYYRTDEKGIIILVSPSIEKYFGYSPDELIGRNMKEFYVNPLGEEEFLSLLIKDGYVNHFEAPFKRKDNSIIWVSTNAKSLIDEEGNFIGVESITRDISGRKHLEDEKTKLETQLQQAQKMEAIGTLAGGIAHDFNNILSPIFGYSEIAMMDLPSDNPAQSCLRNIYQAGKRARDLVNQILAFARRGEEDRIPLRISQIVKESIKFLRSTIPTTIDIQYDSRPEKDIVLADPTRIDQIVINLCTNAAHAMKEKGGRLTVSLNEKYVGSDEIDRQTGLSSGHYLRLSVSDTGHGIPPDIIDKIFEPYFTTKGPGEGTGMGLAVIHGIVMDHGGDISVESGIGKGTTFHVLLPVIDEEVSLTMEPEIKLTGGKERILCVDDEKTAVDTIQAILEKLGYKVEARTSSIEALEAFRNNPQEFDLVITDMTMPNMTGNDFAKELMIIRPDIPIILCTGYSEKIDKNSAKEMGLSAFVIKPIVMREISITIREVLDKGKRPINPIVP